MGAADTPYKTAQDYIEAVKAADDKKFKMGDTGSKQEDQIITVAIERQAGGKKFTYVPYQGGGTVAVQLVGKHVDLSVNNPIEAVQQWKAGALRPLCIFDAKRSTYTGKVTADTAWSDIPTCTEAGLPVEYQMLRGIFMPGGVTNEQWPSMSTCSTRCVRPRTGRSSWRTVRSTDRYDRRGVPQVGRGGRENALRPDEGSGLPGSGEIGGSVRRCIRH